MKQSHKTLLLWVVLIVMFLTIWQFLTPAEKRDPVAFSDFVAEVHQGKVDQVNIKDREYTYKYKNADPAKGNHVKVAVGPLADEALLATLKPDNKDIQAPRVFFEKEDQSPFWSSTIITLIPMAFLILMFFLFMRQLQAGGGKAMSFGKSKARLLIALPPPACICRMNMIMMITIRIMGSHMIANCRMLESSSGSMR